MSETSTDYNTDYADGYAAGLIDGRANGRAEVIRHLREQLAAAEQAQMAMIVSEVLTQRIRERNVRLAVAGRARRIEYPDYLASREIAEEKVGRMTDTQLQASFDAVSDDYWETADSDDHEAYDEMSGEIAVLGRALAELEKAQEGEDTDG